MFQSTKGKFPIYIFEKKKTKPNRLVAFILVLSLSLARTHTAHTQYTHTDTDKGRHTVRHSQHTHTQRQHTPWYKILNSGSFKIFAIISQIISIFQQEIHTFPHTHTHTPRTHLHTHTHPHTRTPPSEFVVYQFDQSRYASRRKV